MLVLLISFIIENYPRYSAKMDILQSANITQVHVERFDGKFSNFWTIFFTVSSIGIIFFGICIERSLFKMLKRRHGRGINRIIVAQQVNKPEDC